MRRRLAGLLAGVLLVVGWAGLAGSPAGAHALLTGSTPADGASLDQPPTQVVLTFTEAPDPSLAVVHVLDAAGARMETGRAEAVVGEPRQLRTPVGPLAKGTYTVTWRTTSALDGHTTVGRVAFGVGAPAAAVAADGTPSGMGPPSRESIAGRWLFYVGVVVLLGAGAVGAVVVSDPSTVSAWGLNGAWGATAVGLVLTVADQRTVTRTGLSRLLASSTGHKLTVQALGVGVAWLAVAWASLRPSRRSLASVGVAASAVMLARAMAGHADASTVPWFTVGVQWAHLVSVGAWVGGLVWFLVALRRGDLGRGRGLARRFSRVAGTTLGVVAVTGTLRALSEVGAWSRLVHTGFGKTLLVKLGLFAALVGLGAVSRFRHVRGSGDGARRGLRGIVRVEVAIGALVLGATAVLTGLPPPATLAAASRSDEGGPSITVTGNDQETSVRVQLEVSPGAVGSNRFHASVTDYRSATPVPARGLTLRFQLNGRPDVAAATVALVGEPDGHWEGSAGALSVEGTWTVTAVVQTANAVVEAPMEVTVRRPG